MIEEGKETVGNAVQIVDADGEGSLPTIRDGRVEDGVSDDQEPSSIGFPSPAPIRLNH